MWEEELVVWVEAANDEEDNQGRYEQASGVCEVGKICQHAESLLQFPQDQIRLMSIWLPVWRTKMRSLPVQIRSFLERTIILCFPWVLSVWTGDFAHEAEPWRDAGCDGRGEEGLMKRRRLEWKSFRKRCALSVCIVVLHVIRVHNWLLKGWAYHTFLIFNNPSPVLQLFVN